MFDEIFDIKNDRRIGIYLYRLGVAIWILYLGLGLPAFINYKFYRGDCGFFAFAMIILGFTVSMVYEYHHHYDEYKLKKKWLLISYVLLAALYYFLNYGDSILK